LITLLLTAAWHRGNFRIAVSGHLRRSLLFDARRIAAFFC
jgi:hypothetical protein